MDKKLKPVVVALVGPIGSGKKDLWGYLDSQIKMGEKISLTKIAEDFAKEKGITFVNKAELREFIHLQRCINGNDFFLRKINFDINATHITIRSIKTKKEIDFLDEIGSDFKVIKIGLDADPEIRLRRAQSEGHFLGYNIEAFLEYEKVFYPEINQIIQICDYNHLNNRDDDHDKKMGINGLFTSFGSKMADTLGSYYPEYDIAKEKDIDPWTHSH